MNEELEKALYTGSFIERDRQRIRDLFAQTIPREMVRELLIKAVQRAWPDYVYLEAETKQRVYFEVIGIADQILEELDLSPPSHSTT